MNQKKYKEKVKLAVKSKSRVDVVARHRILKDISR